MSEQTNLDRRKFLTRLSIIAGAIPAAVVSVPIVSALLGPLLQRQKQDWRKVADLSEIGVGETKLITYLNADPLPWAGTTAKAAAWLRRESEDKLIPFRRTVHTLAALYAGKRKRSCSCVPAMAVCITKTERWRQGHRQNH